MDERETSGVLVAVFPDEATAAQAARAARQAGAQSLEVGGYAPPEQLGLGGGTGTAGRPRPDQLVELVLAPPPLVAGQAGEIGTTEGVGQRRPLLVTGASHGDPLVVAR